MSEIRVKLMDEKHFILNTKGWQKIKPETYKQLVEGGAIVEGAPLQKPLQYKCYKDPETMARVLKCEDGQGQQLINANKPIDQLEQIIKERAGDRPYIFDRLSFYESDIL
jgi:hypothetical protein